MRIEPGAAQVRSPSSNQVASTKPAASRSTAGSTNSITSVDTQSIDAVLQLVSDGNAIRENVVNNIKAQIQNGEYLAKQDAYETASSILNI
ncbi:flagellar biosynthesis anti-sigma factor FlgM [Planctomycetes bacterium K23_9]|uniref:Anti-sigma-28 factor FlgM C-terminal domain-containing protein n=1 Tax=Stieleria marina TaxID=1930275 RepID=A0A517NXQ6_9BACT|nr:hypothetical protein K239x_38810 [Planctomycetes bacterium K23_9]